MYDSCLSGHKLIEFFCFQVYRKCYGQHVGFSMFMDNILLSLARKVNKVNRIYNIDVTVLLEKIPLKKFVGKLHPENLSGVFSRYR